MEGTAEGGLKAMGVERVIMNERNKRIIDLEKQSKEEVVISTSHKPKRSIKLPNIKKY